MYHTTQLVNCPLIPSFEWAIQIHTISLFYFLFFSLNHCTSIMVLTKILAHTPHTLSPEYSSTALFNGKGQIFSFTAVPWTISLRRLLDDQRSLVTRNWLIKMWWVVFALGYVDVLLTALWHCIHLLYWNVFRASLIVSWGKKKDDRLFRNNYRFLNL